VGGFQGGEPAAGGVVDEQCADLVGETDPPRRAGGELLAVNESVVQPADAQLIPQGVDHVIPHLVLCRWCGWSPPVVNGGLPGDWPLGLGKTLIGG